VPRSFHAHAKGALKLAGADAFLRRAHEIHRLKPDAKRRVAVLENGAHLDGKGLAALVALAKPNAGGLAIQLADLGRVRVAAVRAYRAVRPQKRLNVAIGGGFVVEVRGIEN